MMADNKLDPASIGGTGKDGRITKGDVVAAMAKPVPPLRWRHRSCPARQPCCHRWRQPNPTWVTGRSSVCR